MTDVFNSGTFLYMIKDIPEGIEVKSIVVDADNSGGVVSVFPSRPGILQDEETERPILIA